MAKQMNQIIFKHYNYNFLHRIDFRIPFHDVLRSTTCITCRDNLQRFSDFLLLQNVNTRKLNLTEFARQAI